MGISVSKFAVYCASAAVGAMPLLVFAQEQVLQEVVVTAQKREQNLQEVPIAVTAITAEELLNHVGYDLQQVSMLVPGLQFSQEGEDVNIIMRGSPGFLPTGTTGGVTLYQDGMLRQVTSQFQAVFTDTSRVEVARGPQGTLNGRNSFVGSVNVVTNPPEFGVTNFGFNASAYNYSGIRDDVFMNFPFGDAVAVRLSAYRERQDGVMVNVQNAANSIQDRNNDYVRLQIGFKPTDTLGGVVRLSYWDGGGNGSGDYGASTRGVPIDPVTGNTTAGYTSPYLLVRRVGVSCTDPSVDPNTASEIGAPGSSPPLQGGIPAAGPCGQASDYGPYSINQNAPHIRDIQQKEINGDFHWDFLPGVRLRTLLAYTNYSEYRQDDGDYGPSGGIVLSPTNPDNPTPGAPQPGMISINEDYERTRTEELQLLSIGNQKTQWVLGAFFEQNSSYNAFDFANQSAIPGQPAIYKTPRNFNNNSQTLVCCGGPASSFVWYFPLHADLNSWSVYGDAVYSLTDTWRVLGGVRYTHDKTEGIADFWLTIGGPDYPTYANNTFSHTTWRAGFQHDLTPSSMLYATASTGFIAGGPNPAGVAPYEAQTSDSYEIGSKNTLLGGTLRLNADVYYVKYDNLLVSYFNPANSVTTAANAGNSRAYGLELETLWQATTNLRFRGVLSALNSQYGNFVLGPSALLYDGQNLPASYGPGAKGFAADGVTTRNAPKWQANTTTTYDIHLGDYGVLTPAVDLSYVSFYRTHDSPLGFAYQNAYWQTNLRLGWQPPNSPWSVDLYVTNLENNAIRVFTTPNQGGIIYDQYQDPRIYGIRFSYRMK